MIVMSNVVWNSSFVVALRHISNKLLLVQALHLSNNGLKTLPHNLLKACICLSTLDLHNTEITIDSIRQVWTPPHINLTSVLRATAKRSILIAYFVGQLEGWEGFDERRRLKHQKQLDFRVSSSAEFDEGADKNWGTTTARLRTCIRVTLSCLLEVVRACCVCFLS